MHLYIKWWKNKRTIKHYYLLVRTIYVLLLVTQLQKGSHRTQLIRKEIWLDPCFALLSHSQPAYLHFTSNGPSNHKIIYRLVYACVSKILCELISLSSSIIYSFQPPPAITYIRIGILGPQNRVPANHISRCCWERERERPTLYLLGK